MIVIDDLYEKKVEANKNLQNMVRTLLEMDKSTFTISERIKLNDIGISINNLVGERWRNMIKECEQTEVK